MVDERALSKLFHQMILACLAAPPALGSIGCNGKTASTLTDASAGEDSGRRDASSKIDARVGRDGAPRVEGGRAETGHADASCGDFGCGGCSCGPGCEPTTICVNGSPQFACNCDAGIDAGLSCDPDRTTNFYLPLRCIDSGLPGDSGVFTQAECSALCAAPVASCGAVESSGGAMVLGCYLTLGGGRRPAGFRPARSKRGDAPVGRYFAAVAQLEAASVGAFRTLAAELRTHGAPTSLVTRANEAARDEVRHARVIGSLARRYGSTPRRSRVGRGHARSLVDIAIENATEGCVRETFGALTATLQAKTAQDPNVRAAMERIAADETRHAALGWAVSAWVESRLTGDERAEVRRSRDTAVRVLLAEVGHEPPPALREHAGLPDAKQAQSLARELTRRLWA